MSLRTFITASLLALAFAPVLVWYGSRLDDGSGEPLGLVALALAITFSLNKPGPASPRLAEISLVLYALALFLLPPLLRALPALATLAFLTGIHRRAGHLALLLLSLPLQASLDFFLGYPLRLITASGSHFLVSTFIPAVTQTGVQLSLNGNTVSVDPPCSGIQMLWTAAFLTALLASLFKLTYRRTLSLAIAALALCLLANILRASFLFFPEANFLPLPAPAHEGVGLLFFALASLPLLKLARHLRSPSSKHDLSGSPRVPNRLPLLASTVALITLVPARTVAPATPAFEPLTTYQGRPVEELPLSQQEITFSDSFPGQLRIYRVGHDTLIVRQVTKATRMLHPSHHCLRADGFSLDKPTLSFDQGGHPSLKYRASRPSGTFLVTERIRNNDGTRYWADVSAWYWHALFHPDSGPWVAETFLKPTP